MRRWLIVAFLVGAWMVAFAPSASADEGPVVVDTDPVWPDVSGVCEKGQEIVLPDSPPWLYGVHFDEVGNTGAVYAYLPDGFVTPNGGQFWGGDGHLTVWEFVYPGPSCPTPEPVETAEPEPAEPEPAEPAAPEPAVQDPVPGELAVTGQPVLWPVAAVGLVLVGAGVLMRRAR